VERRRDERSGGAGADVFLDDERLELSFALGCNEVLPLLVEIAVDGEGVNEVLAEVLFIAERRANVDGARRTSLSKTELQRVR
jgi:hypothetical protein